MGSTAKPRFMQDVERQRIVDIARRGFRDTGLRGFCLKEGPLINYYPFKQKQWTELLPKFGELLQNYDPRTEALLVGDRNLDESTMILRITGATYETKRYAPKNPRSRKTKTEA